MYCYVTLLYGHSPDTTSPFRRFYFATKVRNFEQLGYIQQQVIKYRRFVSTSKLKYAAMLTDLLQNYFVPLMSLKIIWNYSHHSLILSKPALKLKSNRPFTQRLERFLH